MRSMRVARRGRSVPALRSASSIALQRVAHRLAREHRDPQRLAGASRAPRAAAARRVGACAIAAPSQRWQSGSCARRGSPSQHASTSAAAPAAPARTAASAAGRMLVVYGSGLGRSAVAVAKRSATCTPSTRTAPSSASADRRGGDDRDQLGLTVRGRGDQMGRVACRSAVSQRAGERPAVAAAACAERAVERRRRTRRTAARGARPGPARRTTRRSDARRPPARRRRERSPGRPRRARRARARAPRDRARRPRSAAGRASRRRRRRAAPRASAGRGRRGGRSAAALARRRAASSTAAAAGSTAAAVTTAPARAGGPARSAGPCARPRRSRASSRQAQSRITLPKWPQSIATSRKIRSIRSPLRAALVPAVRKRSSCIVVQASVMRLARDDVERELVLAREDAPLRRPTRGRARPSARRPRRAAPRRRRRARSPRRTSAGSRGPDARRDDRRPLRLARAQDRLVLLERRP